MALCSCSTCGVNVPRDEWAKHIRTQLHQHRARRRQRLEFCLVAIRVAWPQRATARKYIRSLIKSVREIRASEG